MNSWVLGIEIGGTKLLAARGHSDGAIVEQIRGNVDASKGASAILEWLETSVPRLIPSRNEAVSAIGVGFGGPIETATGTVLTSHQVGGWSGFPLRNWFEEKFGLPTVVANDANVSGWAEYCLGAGRGTRNFCYMNIGSGIGGAFVIDGKLYDGQGLGAAEIGHTYIPDWTSPSPGATDKLEHLCSGWSIERRLRASAVLEPATPLSKRCGGDPQRITCAILADAARDGDDFACGVIDQIAQSVGLAIANVITLLHPERVAMGGGVALMGDILLEPVRKYCAQRVFQPYRERYAIVPCDLGESVVAAGALLLARAGYST
jgi:glucokinase